MKPVDQQQCTNSLFIYYLNFKHDLSFIIWSRVERNKEETKKVKWNGWMSSRRVLFIVRNSYLVPDYKVTKLTL